MVIYDYKTKKMKLIIIKELYFHGEKYSFYGTRLDRRLAIISFHNSVELFMRHAIQTKNDNSTSLDKMTFPDKIDKFKSKVIEEDAMHQELDIRNLNNVRNKIYHDYTIPTQHETDCFRLIVELFLKHYTPKVFQI